MSKAKSSAVIADRVLVNDTELGDHVKVAVPEVKWLTAEISGGGIGGSMDMPLQGLADKMSLEIDLRTVGRENAPLLMTPGSLKIELRFNRDVIKTDGSVIRAGTKLYFSCFSAGLNPGSVQRGNAMDGSATFAVYRYRWVEDGTELFLIDQLNEQYKVLGKDYSISAGL